MAGRDRDGGEEAWMETGSREEEQGGTETGKEVDSHTWNQMGESETRDGDERKVREREFLCLHSDESWLPPVPESLSDPGHSLLSHDLGTCRSLQ